MKNKYLLAGLVGVIVLVANKVLSMLLNAALPFLNAEYGASVFRAWSDPLMYVFILYPVSVGVLSAYLWFKTRKSWKTGLDFGITTGLLAAIPMFLINYSTFLLSPLLIFTWALFAFVNALVAGLALEKLEG